MKTETTTNGYDAERIQPMIKTFEQAAEKLFPDCTVRHFYYGEYLVMTDILLEPGEYANFNVSANRVSLTGYTCSDANLKIFESFTYRDECFNGKLFEIA